MDIKILELTDTKAKFILSNATPEIANSLRRVLIAEIPKMAIETVEFHLGQIQGGTDDENEEYESVSPLFDEIIAHRLGLVPIPTDPKLNVFKKDCSCGGEGCPQCTIMYKLDKKGPCDVYSGDLEPLGDPNLKVKDELIPIVRLGPRQAILAYAFAELGTGKMHAKWQVTSGVAYKYAPKVKIDEKKCDRGATCVSACPRRVFAKEGDAVKVVNEGACMLCYSCIKACKSKAISVEGDETKFVFSFETDGSLSAAQTLQIALEILEKKFDEFRELVSALESA
ncbi:MAG: DNA-directed RNA polymerase subunit D [Methanomassiliicoccales archaeon]